MVRQCDRVEKIVKKAVNIALFLWRRGWDLFTLSASHWPKRTHDRRPFAHSHRLWQIRRWQMCPSLVALAQDKFAGR
jgi:hypothetical protein